MRVISIIVCQGACTDPALHEGVPRSSISLSSVAPSLHFQSQRGELSGFFLVFIIYF